MIFAFLLVQVQHNPSFLLGDVLRLNLPDNFVGVHYAVQEDMMVVWSAGLMVWDEVSVSLSYNPDRVSVDMESFVSSHEIVSLDDDGWVVSIVLRVVTLPESLFSVWFVSDEEYHIVVSESSMSRDGQMTSLAIQRL